MRMSIVVVAALSMPAAALAKDKAPDPNKKVCRSQEAVGTLFAKRVCNTAAEWAKIDERDRNDARDFDDNRRNKPDFAR